MIQVEEVAVDFSPNTILVGTADGVYACKQMSSEHEYIDIQQARGGSMWSTGFSQVTASFDELLKLQNLINCERDALNTCCGVKRRVSELLANNRSATMTTRQAQSSAEMAKSTKEKLALISTEVAYYQAAVARAQQNRSIRETIRLQVWENMTNLAEEAPALAEELRSSEQGQESIQAQMNQKMREIFNILSNTFSIEPNAGRPQELKIRGLYLPKSDRMVTDEREQEYVTAAALGLVAKVLETIADYLNVHCPYPTSINGSSCTIFDPISTTANLPKVVAAIGRNPEPAANPYRVFPLTQVGTPEWRFNWGVWILNSNLEAIMARVGLKRQDPRNMMVNLRYLLSGISSGQQLSYPPRSLRIGRNETIE